jgi:CRISPR/Cas system endoribonuclease Cas6 (RAMP superfamily)
MVIELRLHASRRFEPNTRQLHGLACTLFEGSHANGHAGGEKPFTIWPLHPDPQAPGTGWLLRAAWLRAGLPQSVLAACGQLRLGPVTYTVTEVAHRPGAHAQLAAGPPLGTARVEFCSPTYFAQNGSDEILPDPRLIIGSWRRRWNASLPGGDALRVDDNLWQEIHHGVRLSGFDLCTQRMDSGRGHQRAGFTGTASLRVAPAAPEAVRAAFGTLARFAEFSGTGAQTTHGFGATALVSRGNGPG